MAVLTRHQKLALDYSKHISLTANAGSGKTTVFAKRYVEIILNENISLNNIVAITFTDKAASELYNKIAKELEERIDNLFGWKKEKAERLRQNLISAKISTIHSFCIDILKDYAPEAGIDASFSPIDTRLAEELKEKSIEEIISDKLTEDDHFVKYCIRLFGNKSLLSNSLKSLFEKRKTVQLLIDNFYASDLEELVKKYNNLLKNELTRLFAKLIDEFIINVSELNNYVLSVKENETSLEINQVLFGYNKKLNIFEKIKIYDSISNLIATQKLTVRKKGYLPKDVDITYQSNIEFIEESLQELKEFKNFNVDDDLTRSLASFGLGFSNLFLEVNELYTLKKQQRAYLDFEDLLLQTYKLLKNNLVREELTEKYKYIMIDEYQDTDELQYQIFMPILNHLATGNLFVVGDEKQSIYMFREAEVELFNKTKTEIEKIVNKQSLLELPHSFRLAPQIALFTNVLFKRVFRNPREYFNEVEHKDLVCSFQEKTEGKVEILINNSEEPEAELIAKRILKLKNENDYNLSQIAVLCTRKKNFRELEISFSKYAIPYSIVGGKGFYQQQLVYDIYNYLSFLVNTDDDLSLASILRGPFYNLSDIQLTKISKEEGNSFFDKLKKIKSYNEIVEQLDKHILLSKSLTSNELIRKICTDTGYIAYISSKNNAKRELANIEKLIQQSIQINETGFTTLYDFVSYLRDAINQVEDEGHADITEGMDGVNIMTVHQSKGLEYKVVILYKTNQLPKNSNIKSKAIEIDKNYGLLTKLPKNNNFFTEYTAAPIVNLHNYIKSKKELAELKRLLYVAVTRAQEHLIISISDSDRIKRKSFADLIHNSLNIDSNEKEIEIKDELEFMKLENSVYTNRREIITCRIPIITNITENNIGIGQSVGKNIEFDEVYPNQIESYEKNEIISASKISLFLHCPRKYQLTYDFGYGELTKLFTQNLDIELNAKEDDFNIPANIVGSLVHNVLEKETSREDLNTTLKELIALDESIIHFTNEQRDDLENEVKSILNSFYDSQYYKEISGYPIYYNEREFYKKENDFILYGIIDKLIIDDNRIIIIDYKTDKVTSNNVDEKKEIYFNQLLFYAYILMEDFININQFELRLIFLREPNLSGTKKCDRKELTSFGKEIYSAVTKIRMKDYSDSPDGCKDMKYYLLD